jgi:hypothetical protein
MCFFGGNVMIRPDGHRFSVGSFLPLGRPRFLFFEIDASAIFSDRY